MPEQLQTVPGKLPPNDAPGSLSGFWALITVQFTIAVSLFMGVILARMLPDLWPQALGWTRLRPRATL